MNPTNAEVHQFILDTLSSEDLKTFCFMYFPHAEDDFAPDDARKTRAQKLIQYCQHRGLFDNLLMALQQERSEPYKQRFAQAAPAPTAITQPVVRNHRQVFISHAHQDAELAHRLAGDMRQRGWQVWIAPDSIRPGEKWVAAIERGLDESGVFLAVLTPAALASRWVKSETDSAIQLEHEDSLRLIPLLVEQCTASPLLRAYQHVSFLGRYEDGLGMLLAELEPNMSQGSAQAARVPIAKDGRVMYAIGSATHVRKLGPLKAKSSASPDWIVLESPLHIELVRVPAGEFLMGSDPAKDEFAQEDEQPQHHVNVSEFYISKYEVTNAQFSTFVNRTDYTTTAEKEGSGLVWTGSKWVYTPGANWRHPHGPNSDVTGKQDHPVVQVSWHDAVAFCQWLSQVTERNVRLPTEAEWEKAARGTEGRIYTWGNGWNKSRLNSREGGAGDTTPVDKYSPDGDSPYGIADMAGNVCEWTSSRYGRWDKNKSVARLDYPYPYTSNDGRENLVVGNDILRVVRSGSWNYLRYDARAARRDGPSPYNRFDHCGFRIVLGAALGS